MFRILRYLILISLISSGYYLFISEYFHLSEKDSLETEIVKKEKVEDKKEIIQEKKEKVASPNIKKSVEKSLNFKKILCKKGDILIFKNNCPHRSKKNSSSKNRRILYYTYSLKSYGSKYSLYFKDKEKSKNKTSKSLTGEI